MTASSARETGLTIDARIDRGAFRLGLSLVAAPGEVVAILGPNGAGKSTLLRAIAGLTPVTEGTVTLAGRVLDDAGTGLCVEPAERRIGFVFQDYRLFPHLSALDNVAFSPRVRGHGRAAARQVAAGWLQTLGLAELADRKPAQLSGGQAQRIALARALAGDPELLLLDEPLAALDAGTRIDVQDGLRRHLAGFAGPCVLVTHDPLDALVLADRLVVLEDGAIVQQGAPGEVARRPATGYVARLVGLNLHAGRAEGGRVTLDGGGTYVISDVAASGAVLVALRPSAVLVSTDPLINTSARNTWGGTVTGLALLADRVRLDVTGPPDVLVDVTPAAVAELGLRPGAEVSLSVKATDLEVYARAQP